MSYQWLLESGINFPNDSVNVDIVRKMCDAPFIYYLVCRDGSEVIQTFYDTSTSLVENGILTLSGRDENNKMSKVHFPLDFVKHWCEIGPGEKVASDTQS